MHAYHFNTIDLTKAIYLSRSKVETKSIHHYMLDCDSHNHIGMAIPNTVITIHCRPLGCIVFHCRRDTLYHID